METESGAALAAKVAGQAKPARPVFVYSLPESYKGAKSIGLLELTPEEEQMALKRTGGEAMRLAYELAKQSIVEVDGKKVSMGDGSVDQAWNSFTPKVRNLVMTAYTKLHTPEEEESAGFLGSQTVKVG